MCTEELNLNQEQRNRIKYVDEGSRCTFDGLPMHPHYRYYLVCAGFKNLEEVEEKTEQEFIDLLNNGKKKDGSPISICLADVGGTMAEFLKRSGIVFRTEKQ